MQHHRRIEINALPTNRQMQMSSCGPAAGSALGNYLPGGHGIAFFYFEIREMQVEAHQTLTMVDHDEAAFKVELLRQQHSSGIDCVDRCSSRGGIIES